MVKKTLEKILAKINRREAERTRNKKNRLPSGAAANPIKYNKKYRERVLRTAAKYSAERMPGSYNSSFDNPLAVRLQREEIIVDYLLDEGYASDQNAALSIMSVMSDRWVEMILEEY